MTTVIIDGGRTYDIDPAGRTADAVAAEVAAAVLDVPDARFSLKVDGVVLKPSDVVADGNVVELVDVTDYAWPEAVAIAETGSIVDTGASASGRRPSTTSDADPAGD